MCEDSGFRRGICRLGGPVMPILLAVILCASATGRTITVDDDGPADFNKIQAAVDDANNGDVVVVQPGTYTGAGNRDIDFKGKVITVRGDGGAEYCIVDCQGTAEDMHRGFVFQSGEGVDSVLRGLTIINGYAEYGGGIYCTGQASPTIDGCIIAGNVAYTGGGISSETASICSPIIKNCIIVGNRAVYDEWWVLFSGAGGGIYICGDGGGWWNCGPNHTAYPAIRNCTIVGNVAELTGGGVYSVLSCDMTIENCIIRDNATPKGGRDQDIGIALLTDSCNPTCRVSYSNVEGGLDGIDVYYFADWGEGNIDADPCFANPDDGDYRIRENSPCVDSGDPNFVPSPREKDVYGNNRVLNGIVDMGATETSGALVPILCLSPSQISLDANEAGIDPDAYMLSVYNGVEGSVINWEITGDCEWLNIAPASGQSSGEVDQVVLLPEVSGLSKGVYSCELTVSSDVGLGSPQVVPVDLTVHGPVIDLSKDMIEFEGIKGHTNPPAQSFTLRNIGAKVLNWEIENVHSWLTFEPSYGSTGDEIVEIIVTCNIEGLIGGTHSCEVLISDSAAENSPQLLTVNLYLEDDDGVLSVPSEYPTIQSAIDAAINGEEVVVSPGTYTGQGNRDLYLLGKTITVRSVAPHDPCVVFATIIDCQANAADQHRGFYLHRHETLATVVDGFTIINGYAEYGGGIYIRYSSPRIRNCIVQNCSAVSLGGGIASAFRTAVIEKCTISNNQAWDSGGGVYLRQVATVVSDCRILYNTAPKGGGMYVGLEGSYPSAVNCTIVGNTADSGGGIYAHGRHGPATIELCTVVANYASEGGGICCESGTLMLENSIVWANTSGMGSQIALTGPSEFGNHEAACRIASSDVYRGSAAIYVTPSSTLTWLEGNIDSDPLFADAENGEYHLMSQAGRWDPNAGSWVQDDMTSPCIDAGDPTTPIGPEPFPNGGVVNMGAYGGTAQASKSWFGGPVCETIVAGDVNGDCVVDFRDLSIMMLHWLEEH